MRYWQKNFLVVEMEKDLPLKFDYTFRFGFRMNLDIEHLS